MNQYRAQATRRDGFFTFLLMLMVLAGIFIPAIYYGHTELMPALHRFIEQLNTH